MLSELLTSIDRRTRETDAEVIVVRAGGDQDPRDVAVEMNDVVRVIDLPGGVDDERIAYSDARNLGAESACGEHVMFVDADTILGPSTIDAMDRSLGLHDALCTGDLAYLPPGHAGLGDATFDELAATARPHPARPAAPATGVEIGSDHALVWGLNMAMRRSTFERAGGFDESFHGYAGEDTDLAMAIARLGVPTGLVAGVKILHQHHDSFEPPVGEFRATLANARRYQEKWGGWPMGGWLDGFEEIGLIERHGDEIHILRDPTLFEVAAARQDRARPFRSVPNGECEPNRL